VVRPVLASAGIVQRLKIYASLFWKEFCFGLTAETLVDRAMGLQYVGGTYGGNTKPTKFLCLVLKMLQLQPEKEIIIEFIKNEDYKYVRILGAFYLRLVGKPADIYKYLELLYNDYRKIRVRAKQGWEVIRVDEFIDELLTSDYSCDIALPRLPKRWHLEDAQMILARVSLAGQDLEDGEEDDADAGEDETKQDPSDGTAGAPSPSQGSREVEHNDAQGNREAERGHSSGRRDHRRRTEDRGMSRGRSRSLDRRRKRSRGRTSSRERSFRERRRSPSADRRSRRSQYSNHRSWSRSRSRSRSYDSRGARHGRRDRGRNDGDHRRDRKRSRGRSYSRSCSKDSRDRRPAHSRQRGYQSSVSRSRSPHRQRYRDRHHWSWSPGSSEDEQRDRRRKNKRDKRKEAAKSKLFKGSSASTSAAPGCSDQAAGNAHEEGSVDYWNEQRAKLGLKPLKP